MIAPRLQHASASTSSHACPPDSQRLLYALLFRGEIYRYGCDENGMHTQDLIMQSHHVMVTRSLEQCGARVDVLFTLDGRGCANMTLQKRLTQWHPGRKPLVMHVTAQTQPQSIRSALNWYSAMMEQYDVLILTRYDLNLLQPLVLWPGCRQTNTIGIASRCEAVQWRQWNCSSDVLFVVPTTLFAVFNASVGSQLERTDSRQFRASNGGGATLAPAACFASSGEHVSKGVPRGLGHGCYNALMRHVSSERLSFCWPSGRGGVTDHNEYYQCCRHHSRTELSHMWSHNTRTVSAGKSPTHITGRVPNMGAHSVRPPSHIITQRFHYHWRHSVQACREQ